MNLPCRLHGRVIIFFILKFIAGLEERPEPAADETPAALANNTRYTYNALPASGRADPAPAPVPGNS